MARDEGRMTGKAMLVMCRNGYHADCLTKLTTYTAQDTIRVVIKCSCGCHRKDTSAPDGALPSYGDWRDTTLA